LYFSSSARIISSTSVTHCPPMLVMAATGSISQLSQLGVFTLLAVTTLPRSKGLRILPCSSALAASYWLVLHAPKIRGRIAVTTGRKQTKSNDGMTGGGQQGLGSCQSPPSARPARFCSGLQRRNSRHLSGRLRTAPRRGNQSSVPSTLRRLPSQKHPSKSYQVLSTQAAAWSPQAQ
jgi:hypothetical protein